MQEQTAVLVEDHGKWILVIDSDDNEAERSWQDIDAAMAELAAEGWQVAQGPARIRPSMAALERFELWGYRLRRGVH